LKRLLEAKEEKRVLPWEDLMTKRCSRWVTRESRRGARGTLSLRKERSSPRMATTKEDVVKRGGGGQWFWYIGQRVKKKPFFTVNRRSAKGGKRAEVTRGSCGRLRTDKGRMRRTANGTKVTWTCGFLEKGGKGGTICSVNRRRGQDRLRGKRCAGMKIRGSSVAVLCARPRISA